MMDVREKLVEIMEDLGCNDEYCKDCEFCNDIDGCVHRQKEIIADRLIANGVTVQEWVSVEDELPQENGRYLTANKRWDDKINVFDLWFDGGFWYVDGEDDVFDFEVTHWMPMPQPPKGE